MFSKDELMKDAIGRLLIEHLSKSKLLNLFTFEIENVCPFFIEQFYANAQTIKPDSDSSDVSEMILRTVIEGEVIDVTPKLLGDILNISSKGPLTISPSKKKEVCQIAFELDEIDTFDDKHKKRTGEVMFHLHTLTSKGLCCRHELATHFTPSQFEYCAAIFCKAKLNWALILWHNMWLAVKRYRHYKSLQTSNVRKRVWMGFGRLISLICSKNSILAKKLVKHEHSLQVKVKWNPQLLKNKLRFYKLDMSAYRVNFGYTDYHKAWYADQAAGEPLLEPLTEIENTDGKYAENDSNLVQKGADEFDEDWTLEKILIDSAVIQSVESLAYLKKVSANNSVLPYTPSYSTASSEESTPSYELIKIQRNKSGSVKKLVFEEEEVESDPVEAAKLEKKKGKLPMIEDGKKKKKNLSISSIQADDIFMGQAKKAAQAQEVKDKLKANIAFSKSLSTKATPNLAMVVSNLAKDFTEKETVDDTTKVSKKRVRISDAVSQGEKVQTSSELVILGAGIEGEQTTLAQTAGADSQVQKKRRSARLSGISPEDPQSKATDSVSISTSNLLLSPNSDKSKSESPNVSPSANLDTCVHAAVDSILDNTASVIELNAENVDEVKRIETTGVEAESGSSSSTHDDHNTIPSSVTPSEAVTPTSEPSKSNPILVHQSVISSAVASDTMPNVESTIPGLESVPNSSKSFQFQPLISPISSAPQSATPFSQPTVHPVQSQAPSTSNAKLPPLFQHQSKLPQSIFSSSSHSHASFPAPSSDLLTKVFHSVQSTNTMLINSQHQSNLLVSSMQSLSESIPSQIHAALSVFDESITAKLLS